MLSFEEFRYSVRASGESGVHLVVDAGFSHPDLESALVTPSIIPRVDAKPVVFTTFSAPANRLNGMATKS